MSCQKEVSHAFCLPTSIIRLQGFKACGGSSGEGVGQGMACRSFQAERVCVSVGCHQLWRSAYEDVCVCRGVYLNSWNAVFLCNLCISGFSLSLAGGQDVVTRVTAVLLPSLMSKYANGFPFSNVTCTVRCSMCKPSCHSDSYPPITHCASAECDGCNTFLCQISLQV